MLDCLNASDLLLSDVSSVVSDYLFSGKPFAMFAVGEPASFAASYPVARAAYVVPADPATDDPALAAALDEALGSMLGDDPLAGTRRAVRADQLAVDDTADTGDTGDTGASAYVQRFVDAVAAVVDAPPPAAAEIVESDDGTPIIASSRIRAVVVAETAEVSVAVLALVGLGAALAVAPGWLVAAPLVVAAAVAGFLQLRAVRADLVAGGDGADAVGRFAVGRGIALVAAVAGLVLAPVLHADPAASLTGLVAVAVVGAVAGALALACEGPVAAAWDDPAVEAVDVPGLDLTVAEALPRGLTALAGSAAVLLAALMLALTATGAPAWLWALPLVAHLVVATPVLVPALRRLVLARAAGARVPVAVADLAPELCLYFGSGIGATYQAGMWLRWLVAIDRPLIVVTRTVPSLREIAAVARRQGLQIPILYRPTLRSLEDVIVPSLTTAFYVNNAVKNTHFIERRELTHVWLNHGDSEKPACYNPVHAIYDLIFAAGQAGVDRYARHGVRLPAEKFRIVGRPQASVIDVVDHPVPAEPTVLYAPTWQGPYADSRVSSLPVGREIVQALLDRGATVVFRAHPFSYRYDEPTRLIREIGALLAADRERTGRAHRFGADAEQAMTVEECFNVADAMVSDVSATLSDFLMSAKPYAVVAVGRDRTELVGDVPAAAGGYVIADDLDNLDAALDDLMLRDPLAAERRRLRTYYLGDFPTPTYADGFLTAARAVVDGQDR